MATKYSLVLNGTQIQELQPGDSLLGSIAHLTGGAVGQVPYQSASGTTAFTSTGTSGQVLQSNGAAAPTWVSGYASTGKAIAMALVFGG